MQQLHKNKSQIIIDSHLNPSKYKTMHLLRRSSNFCLDFQNSDYSGFSSSFSKVTQQNAPINVLKPKVYGKQNMRYSNIVNQQAISQRNQNTKIVTQKQEVKGRIQWTRLSLTEKVQMKQLLIRNKELLKELIGKEEQANKIQQQYQQSKKKYVSFLQFQVQKSKYQIKQLIGSRNRRPICMTKSLVHRKRKGYSSQFKKYTEKVLHKNITEEQSIIKQQKTMGEEQSMIL